MKKIKKLLAEYEIRFHDTDEILESSAFNPKDFVNKREYSIQMCMNFKSFLMLASLKYCLYL